MTLYAAYGSNLHPLRLRRRVASAEPVGTASVGGWALRFHKRSNLDGSAKCDIVRAENSRIWVAVFRLEDADLGLLDHAEGKGNGYEHFDLDVPGHGRVLTYQATASHIDERLIPFSWYKAYVLAGCAYHGFDPAYVDRVRDHPQIEDPEVDRHRRHMARIRRFPP